MMLRSASTPSLVSPFTGSPAGKHPMATLPTAAHHGCGQVSCNSHAGFQNIAKSLVNAKIQRAQSAGELEEIYHVDDLTPLSRQSSKRLSRMNTLEAIPSFHPSDDDDDDDKDVLEEGNLNQLLMVAHEELNGYCDVGFLGEGKMYLAMGIGVNAIGFYGCGGGGLNMENHYKNMVLQSPSNPLFLKNYAHFLYQTKGDLVGAEEYYSRAISADPEDGDILCEYGKLIWEVHHDKQTARSYFERALQASSGDCSKISASYASFLWDIDDEDEDDNAEDRFLHHGIITSATA